MNVEEALEIIEKVLDYERLNKVQEMVFRQSWEGRFYSEIAANLCYEPKYIKQVGFHLWKSLSKAFGKKVTKHNLPSILKQYAQETQRSAIGNTPAAKKQAQVIAVPAISLSTADVKVNSHNPETSNLRGVSEFNNAIAKLNDTRGSFDSSVKLWDVCTGKCLQTLQGHTNRVGLISFSPDSQTLASGSYDRTIKLWDVNTDQCWQLQGHADAVSSVTFSPNGQILASGSSDSTVRLWDVRTGQCLQILQGHTDWVWSVAWSPEGKIIASGSSDHTVRLWGISDGKCLQTLYGHTSWVLSVVFSSDGKTLASSSQDETIKLWDIQTGECLKTLRSSKPCEGMSITGATGLTEAQKATLKVLGAIEL